MSYFNTQFQGASMPITDAMRTRDFIARQKEQENQRREKSKQLAEDQKRLGMMAQGLGLEKGEVDSLSRGELQGFIDSEINKKNQIDQIQQREVDLQKFLRDAQNEDAKNKINLFNAQTNLNNSLIAMSKNQAVVDETENNIRSDKNIVKYATENYSNKDFQNNYPSTSKLIEAGASNRDISKSFREENSNLSTDKKLVDLAQLADEKLIPEVSKDYAEYLQSGGPLSATRKIRTFQNVLGKLESGEVETGKFTNLFGELVRKYITDPEGMDAQQQVQKVIAETLKETLGAQFTEKEATQLLQRSYDPELPSKFNIDRLKVAIKEITETTDYKIRLFTQFANDPTKIRSFILDSKNSNYKPSATTTSSGTSYKNFNNLNLPGGNVTTTPSTPTPPAVAPQQPGIVLPQNFQQNPPLNPGSLPNSFMPPVSPVKDINQMLNQSLQKNSVIK